MDYHRPVTVSEALAVLARYGGEARLLAGGQDLVPLLNTGRLAPAAVVDLKALSHLAAITAGVALRVGALATHRDILTSAAVRTACPLLTEAAGLIGGGPQVRNRGTIGGSVAARNPAYDYAAPLLAVDAELWIAGPTGERRAAAEAFLGQAPSSEPAPMDLLLAISVQPIAPEAGWAYEKLRFSDGCYTIAAAAAVVAVDARGACASARLAVSGVEPAPARLRDVEEGLVGARLDDAVLAEAGTAVERRILRPISDALADGDYRRAMAGVVVQRALARAARRAGPHRGGAGTP
jgi:carbon-monoxide dehydrogenase medium subunit